MCLLRDRVKFSIIYCKGLNDALIIHSYNDVINIGQEVEGQYTSICIAVRTCTRVVCYGEGECGRDEGRIAFGGGEDGGGEGSGGKAEDGESAGAAKQGGKVSSVPISAHHGNSGTRVVSTSASGGRGVICQHQSCDELCVPSLYLLSYVNIVHPIYLVP